MGNNSAKETDSCQKKLDELFFKISNGTQHVTQNELRRTWSTQIDLQLYSDIEFHLFNDQNLLYRGDFKQLFLDICKGNSGQKFKVLRKLMRNRHEIPFTDLVEFVTKLLNSILIIQEEKSPKQFHSWTNKMGDLNINYESVSEYGAYLLRHTQKKAGDKFTLEDMDNMLTKIDFFLHMVFCRLYDTEEKDFYTNVLPKWRYGAVDSGKNLEEISVLDLTKIIFLNLQLPVDFQHEWRILFSTSVHGESFSKLLAQIINKGPTIIILKDRERHIYGAFASSSWSVGPNFFGDSRNFLFSLYPEMSLHLTTNDDKNCQYLNVGQKTMPNGLGMGTNFDCFGLWLSAEFGSGYWYTRTKSDNGLACFTRNLEISHLEVWGVGPPPPTAEEQGERSVLDGNLEAKAILQMYGKSTYSEGLRE